MHPHLLLLGVVGGHLERRKRNAADVHRLFIAGAQLRRLLRLRRVRRCGGCAGVTRKRQAVVGDADGGGVVGLQGLKQQLVGRRAAAAGRCRRGLTSSVALRLRHLEGSQISRVAIERRRSDGSKRLLQAPHIHVRLTSAAVL